MEQTTTYTTTETHDTKKDGASPATTALAVVGFITLVVLGILLAIYSARYVPSTLSTLFSSGTGKNNPSLNVVSSTTIPFSQETATTTALVSGGSTTRVVSGESQSQTTTVATPAEGTTQTTTQAPRLYGLSNLSITVLATGYLAHGTTDSFVPAAVIPPGVPAAVRFSIGNTGTNVTGPWSFAAALPTQGTYAFTSPIEQSLNPGDHIVFTLGFDQAQWGTSPLTILADPQNMVAESNELDNNATAVISVQ